jgi:hypothetical protein
MSMLHVRVFLPVKVYTMPNINLSTTMEEPSREKPHTCRRTQHHGDMTMEEEGDREEEHHRHGDR